MVYNKEKELLTDPLSPWRFCGKRVDRDTGRVLFERRSYDPKIGRWTTPDPLFFEDGINRYAYVKNRPTLYIDPDGLRSARMSSPDLSKRFFDVESS